MSAFKHHYMSQEDYVLKVLSGDVVPESSVLEVRWSQHWEGMVAAYTDGAKYIWLDGAWCYLHIGARPEAQKMHACERVDEQLTHSRETHMGDRYLGPDDMPETDEEKDELFDMDEPDEGGEE